MNKSDLVSLGRIVKTQGLKGAIRVLPHSHESANLGELERIVIVPPKAEGFSAKITDCRIKGSVYILTVAEIANIDQAEKLVGGEILADPDDFAPLEEGEFYWYEVIGMEVVTDEGEKLGKVESVIPTGANDVLQVKTGKKEILLPNIPDVILDIDFETKVITVHLLPGLL